MFYVEVNKATCPDAKLAPVSPMLAAKVPMSLHIRAVSPQY